VAVHPDDARYKDLVGKEIEVEGANGLFTIKVIADEHVDPKFGTGVVKITPAHDFNDWEIGERHHLPVVQVISLDGTLNEKAGRFAGMTVLEARAAVVKALQEKNLITKIEEDYRNRVGVCYKCKTVIEPMLLDQWFVAVKSLAKRAIEALDANKVTFTPKNKNRVLKQYLEGLKDWNISRQIPWGIPIPAFRNVNDPTDWRFDTRVEESEIIIDGKTYRRDEDTFDTWFSSGQWPFVTTDYMDEGDLSPYYPLSVMETGSDILYSWVARMLMLGLYCTNQVPFKHVYLHGMVLDEHGQKMSKSKGNVISPVDLMNDYGSDALRMGLLAGRGPAVGQAFSPATVIAGRNFCNKLWNMARFIEHTVGDDFTERVPTPISLADHWVLAQLEQASVQIAKFIEQYRFSEAYEVMYHVIWDDVADWYLEASKVEPNKSLLAYILEVILKIAHPFAPFVTETIWQTLQWESGMLIHAAWPEQSNNADNTLAGQFSDLQSIVTEARFVSSQLGASKQTLLFEEDTFIEANRDLIIRFAKLESIEQRSQASGIRLALANHEAWLAIDPQALEKHTKQLEARLEDCKQHIKQLEQRLQNKAYIANAPAEIVAETKQLLEDQKKLQARLERELQR
jgi:valyl-tRNA synthetase